MRYKIRDNGIAEHLRRFYPYSEGFAAHIDKLYYIYGNHAVLLKSKRVVRYFRIKYLFKNRVYFCPYVFFHLSASCPFIIMTV